QPHTSVLSDAHVTVQAVTVGKTVARVRHNAGTVAIAECIAALTRGGADDCLRTVIDCLTLISLVRQRISQARNQRIRAGAEGFVISSAIGWREAAFYPQVTIIITVCINRVRAGSGIRNQRAAGPLISPKDRIDTDV